MDVSLFPFAALALVCVLSPLVHLATRKERHTAYFVILGLCAAMFLFVAEGLQTKELFGGLLVVDPFSLFFSLLFLLMALLVSLASLSSVTRHEVRFYALLSFATLGLVLVACARDLLVLYVSLELASNATYVLAGFARADGKSNEASMKYFLIGTFSSAILVFGMSLVFGVTAHTDFSGIASSLSSSPVGTLGVVFVMAGLAFKVASVPFHMWAPDTYEGAPTPVTAFLASASKKAGFAAMMRLFMVAFIALKVQWTFLFSLLALLTMTLGNLAALSQKSVKRMLAYSSIAQAGYILIAMALGTPSGITAGLYHILAHSLMAAGAFFVVMVAESSGLRTFEEYASFSRSAPLPAFSLALFLVSLAGIPPLAGFFGKFYLFMAALEGGLAWLAVAGILNSALSLYYYARVIKYMYLPPPSPVFAAAPSRWLTCAIVISLAGTVVFGLFPQLAVNLLRLAVEGLF